jgi:hypothetical protein
MIAPNPILVKQVDFQTKYTEHKKALTKLLIKSTFATHQTYINIEQNLEILHTLRKGPKQNTIEQYEIYKHYKQSPTNILNY